jgi:predicted house-cleaning noncanonical NTP pyrophosphatase (MazG superfamily)
MGFKHTITDLPTENEYPKLVRDKIPQIIKTHDGVDVPTRTLDEDTEFLAFLLRKIVEESEELSEATTNSNLIEEIADVNEIIDTILKLKGISPEEVLAVQHEKRDARGGFEKRLLMLAKHQ